MKQHELIQGTEDWKKFRLSHFTASEAPSMMGASKNFSRDDLLTYKTTHNEKQVSDYTLRIYENGHKTEALARPIADEIIGQDVYAVTGSEEIEGLPLLASFDGLNMAETIVWEHKQWNAEKAAKLKETGELEPEHYWQLEQQLLVSNAEKALFMFSDGTKENNVSHYYFSVPERRAALIAGWKQFKKDLEGYVPKVYEEAPEAEAIMELPALSVQLVGQVKESNLAIYQKTAMEFIESINTDLQTDQDFANAEKMVKFCDKTEKELELVKKQALEQTADVAHLFRTVDMLKESMRAKRLELNKLVTQKKEMIRNQIMQRGIAEFNEYVSEVNEGLEFVVIQPAKPGFADAMKGKKTIKSLNEAVNDELARAKIETEQAKELVLHNLKTYKNLAANHQFLFNDLQQLIFKESVDFTLLVESRIDKHDRAEEHRKEAERKRIQQEEEAKAQAKVQAEMRAKQAAQEALEATKHELTCSSEFADKGEPMPLPQATKAKASDPEQDIVDFLCNELSIFLVDAQPIAKALITGRVPHVSFSGKTSKAA